MSKRDQKDKKDVNVNERYNVTKNKGRGLHLRVLARMAGLSIMYGFEHVWLVDRPFAYREARPYLEGLCEARKLPIYQVLTT